MQRMAEKVVEGLHRAIFGKTRNERAFARGEAAASADMPRWRRAIEATADKGKSWVTIPVQGWFRPFFRHGGEGLLGYYEKLKRELGDEWLVQPEWSVDGHMHISVRRLRSLDEIMRSLKSMERLNGFSNEDATLYGRLTDEKAAVERLAAKRSHLLH